MPEIARGCVLGLLPLPRGDHCTSDHITRAISGTLGRLPHCPDHLMRLHGLSWAISALSGACRAETDEKAVKDGSETEVRRSDGSIETPLRR